MITYTDEEKREYVEEYKVSGLSISAYAKSKGIAETTFSGWIKADRDLSFGAIEIKPSAPIPKATNNTTVFVTPKIRIELKEGYDKDFLKKIIGVLVND